MLKNCNKCGSEMNLIPAGISKKNGKSYDAFYSCKECNHTESAGGPTNVNLIPRGENETMTLLIERVRNLEEWRENIKNA